MEEVLKDRKERSLGPYGGSISGPPNSEYKALPLELPSLPPMVDIF